MSFKVQNAVQVPLELFGGLVTQQPAMNLPAGVSPDCSDVVFTPTSVQARPGLTKVFASPFGSVTLTYAKSYVDNSGVVHNLYLDSVGNLWVENVSVSAGTFTLLGTTTPGTYAKSVTAFGREYIAISDGLRGQELPLQYDGTFLDRVTQDGPGSPPIVSSLIIPAVAMAASSAPVTLTMVSVVLMPPTEALVTVTAGALGLSAATFVTLAGSSLAPFSGAGSSVEVLTILSDTQVIVGFYSSASGSGVGGTLTYGGAFTLSRASNIVTGVTATPHNLKVGYQVQISNVLATPVGGGANGIVSIVITNEDNPGVATVTTLIAHGLLPGNFVSIVGIQPAIVGGHIAFITNNGNGLVQVTTTAPHGLNPGAVIEITGTGVTQFNISTSVVQVPDPQNFTFATADLTAANAAAGTVSLAWPILSTPTPQYFEVLSAPTPTTFQVAINYVDGTWTSSPASGTVNFGWDGTFYVTAVLSPTKFQYQQYGPNATSVAFGIVTPFGQAAPGLHQCQVLFLTRQQAITAPSPPVKFEANGGQYISVANIPIGPPNTIARILAFTGADGAYFFYIPVPAQVSGQQVSTATQINDNTTTAVLLDFSDATLFAAIGISIPGNNLSNQIVLDSALGFTFYGERLTTYGQRNRIQNFENLSFWGGTYSFPVVGTGMPTGWLPQPGGAGGAVITLPVGTPGPQQRQAWQITGAGGQNIYQTAYLDWRGVPILTGNTPYKARAWVKGGTVTLSILAGSTGFLSTATLVGTTGGWVEANFTLTMPLTIPADMLLVLTGTANAIVADISIIFQQVPFIDHTFFGSYVNNPEGFDGVSGVFGGGDDTRKIMTAGIVRGALVHLTQEPAGRLHSTINNGVTEPAGWTTNEVAADCGAMSTFSMTVSQADDATAAGGEEWIAWMSYTGARIYGGDQPWKISQEIQPDWDAINTGAWLTTWALNDPQVRRIYFGLPKDVLTFTSPGITASAPNKIYHVDYKNMDTAFEIAQSPPVHVTFTGKLAARDHARKWAPWNVPANGASMIYRNPGGPLYTVFLAGNGQFPNAIPGGCGNVFGLCQNKLTDDCLGQMFPYYFTYAFTSAELEQTLQLGGQRHLLQYLQWNARGVGNLVVTPYVNSLSNPWPINMTVPLQSDPAYDDEWGGGNAAGQRIFLKFAVVPTAPVGPS